MWLFKGWRREPKRNSRPAIYYQCHNGWYFWSLKANECPIWYATQGGFIKLKSISEDHKFVEHQFPSLPEVE